MYWLVVVYESKKPNPSRPPKARFLATNGEKDQTMKTHRIPSLQGLENTPFRASSWAEKNSFKIPEIQEKSGWGSEARAEVFNGDLKRRN